jgi:hypothetical protein
MKNQRVIIQANGPSGSGKTLVLRSMEKFLKQLGAKYVKFDEETHSLSFASLPDDSKTLLATDGEHDHTCHCGTSKKSPHNVGEDGCVRFMTKAPRPVSCEEDRWMVDGKNITGFTLRQQRGYHKHPCGCWSRWPGSSNSIEA